MAMNIKEIDGLPILNAQTPLMINVTEKDCTNGNAKHPDSCAAARCLMRELNASEVRVHLSRVYIKTSPDKWVRYFTSKALRTEIVAFDRGGQFAPGTYRLTPMTPSKSKGGRQGSEKVAAPKRKKKRLVPSAPRHVLTDVRTGPA